MYIQCILVNLLDFLFVDVILSVLAGNYHILMRTYITKKNMRLLIKPLPNIYKSTNIYIKKHHKAWIFSARSLIFCVVFCRSLLVLLSPSFCLCVTVLLRTSECLTPTQYFFPAISWREQINFQ